MPCRGPAWGTLAPRLMHAALLLAALAAAPAGGRSPGDPCSDVASLPGPASCGLGTLCAPRDRAKVACGLRDAMAERYVFFEAKGALLGGGFDSRAHLDACAAAERAIAREDDPLAFYDRMRRCTAAFQDGHLLFGVPGKLPQVGLGIGLRRVAGKVVVATREPQLLALSGAGEVLEAVRPGAEVVAIDGRPVAELLDELAGEVPGGSGPARLERAVLALTRRDFAFPARRTAVVTLSQDGELRTVALPWWTSPEGRRHPAARAWVARTGIPETTLLPWGDDAMRSAPGITADGAPRTEPILAPPEAAGLREWTDASGRVAVRLGVIERGGGRAFGYLQLLTLNTEALLRDGERRPYGEVVEAFVRECRERRAGVVVDLRVNDGGFLDHATRVARALAPANASQPGGAILLRASERNEAVYRARAPATGSVSPVVDDPLAPAHILGALEAARRSGRALTPGFVQRPFGASGAVGGFGGRVVVLTGPACSSACERIAGLLHASGHAVLVGEPTEGAGGSQQEARDLPARWTDPGAVLSLSIPNAAFGVPRDGAAVLEGAEVAPELFFDAYGIENRPVQPDVPYAPTLDDLVSHNRGWLERVEAILFGEAPRSKLAAAARTRLPSPPATRGERG